MADRRMFAKTIVESDAFTSMSAKAQSLYFRLGMDADDDGFMNNALSICRGLGYTKAVLQELLDKRFLLDLGNGVTVVKHWKVNNYIQKDRYKATIYQEQFKRLKVKTDGSYTECIHDVYALDTQSKDSLGKSKDSLGKDTLEEDSSIKEITARMLEMGYSSELCDRALNILNTEGYPHTASFYQTILNVLTDENVYNKEGYIFKAAQKEVKA